MRLNKVELILLFLAACVLVFVLACNAATPVASVVHEHHHHEPVVIEPTCVVPPATDPGWGSPWKGVPLAEILLEDAKAVVGDRCGLHPVETLKLLAEAIKSIGGCAAFLTDAVFVELSENLFEEYHAVAYTTGCYTGHRAYRGTWIYTPEGE